MPLRRSTLCLAFLCLLLALCPGAGWSEQVPFSPAADKLFTRGVKAYTKGQYSKARDTFVDLVKQPLNQRSSAAQLMLGRALFHLGEYERGLQVAQRLETKYPDSPLIADACLVGGDCCYALQRYAEAALLYGRALAHAKASLPLKGQAAERLAALSANGTIAGPALERLEKTVGAGLLRDGLAYGTVRWYQRLGWEGPSRAAQNAYRRQHAGGVFMPLVAEGKAGLPRPEALVAEVITPNVVPPRSSGGVPRLGLLLPLSGPNTALGRELLEGVSLANREQDNPFELVPVDTGFEYGNLPVTEGQDSELVRTGRAMQSLIADDKVLAVIGPVFSGPAVLAAVSAEAAGLPLVVPLAQQSGLDSLGNYTFQLRPTPEAQAQALGEYATLALGLKTLVVLAPLTDYGWTFEREFTQAAQAKGGRVVYRDWYLPDQQRDFRRHFAEIRRVGLALKPPVPDSLAADSLDTPGTAGEEVVDTIDGMVVVVESFEDAKTIAPQLHFHQVKTQILGNDIWYDPESLAELSADERQDFLGCMFVSSREEDTPAARQFSEAFRRQAGRPGSYAVYGYDAARLVIAGWQGGKRERGALRDWLATVQGFAGASGKISFGPRRQTNTELAMLKISRRGQIVPASQPEEPEEPPPLPPETPEPGAEEAPADADQNGQ
ncbi:MAG: ABC transporter substrate-binding protein [Candidatus Latescibacteria bacterium]|nr:ABC transporter substrate-binding protein [Candidatus Latescibacterota bacterium]